MNGIVEAMNQTANLELPSSGLKVLQSRIRQVLLLLFQARCYAQELQHDDWDFAVELSKLLAAGPNINDCRWLVCKGYVEHACEITTAEHLSRQFQPTPLLSFNDRTCFVLTDMGENLAAELARCGDLHYSDARCGGSDSSGSGSAGSGLGEIDGSEPTSAPAARNSTSDRTGAWTEYDRDDSLIPSWDGERHQLRLGNLLIKEFKLNSPNQETIMMAFEEEGWPPRIDDPLPHHPELEPKRRLHDTIKSLNRNQKNRLIRFMGDGTGRAIRWELATQLPHQGASGQASAARRQPHSKIS